MVKLKAPPKKRKGTRNKYQVCTEEENKRYNRVLGERLRTQSNEDRNGETQTTESRKRRLDEVISILNQTRDETLPKVPKIEKKTTMSEGTTAIQDAREAAIQERDKEMYEELTKAFIRNKREDKKQQTINELSKELYVRDRWMGIRRLKNEFKPIPYSRKRTNTGEHVGKDRIAEESAKYLATSQWKDNGERHNFRTRKNVREETHYETGEITLK